MTAACEVGASYRDPSGHVFRRDGVLYRQINHRFRDEYDAAQADGIYERLIAAGQLVSHSEVDLALRHDENAYRVLQPTPVPFVSYPYEWCFSQLKSAALLTLDIQRSLLERGFSLRDASAFNVQFVGSRPVLIDTLSIGRATEGAPWIAYRQFCSHFLGPLALMSLLHVPLAALWRQYLDGFPLDLVLRLLPSSAWLRPGIVLHLQLHGRTAASKASRAAPDPPRSAGATMSRRAVLGLVESLHRTVDKLSWRSGRSTWSHYTAECSYSQSDQASKQQLVRTYLDTLRDRQSVATVWDLGANTGEYSDIASLYARHVVAFDLDSEVVEAHVRRRLAHDDRRVLPLVQDFGNPSPGLGWHSRERDSLPERGPADVALALALVHHLAIGLNVPLLKVAAFFADICRAGVVEFVPKDDVQVRRMLAAREDVFPDYTLENFLSALERYFRVLRRDSVGATSRTLILLERR